MEGSVIGQKARELMNYWFAESDTVKSVDVYGALIDMGMWYENRIKDYLIKRYENLPIESSERNLISSVFKDLFEDENNTI